MCRRDTTEQRNAVLRVGDSKALAETDPSLVSLLSATQYHAIPYSAMVYHVIPDRPTTGVRARRHAHPCPRGIPVSMLLPSFSTDGPCAHTKEADKTRQKIPK